MRRLSTILAGFTAIATFASSALAELGTDVPPDDDMTLLTQRELETGCTAQTTTLCSSPTANSPSADLFNSGIFDVKVPGSDQTFQPAERVPRDNFGVVGLFMLKNGLQEQLQQLPKLDPLGALVFPSTSDTDKGKLAEGMTFFTMFHTPSEGMAPDANGVGPINNQPACIGCHLNAAEAVKSQGLLQGQGCQTPGSGCTNVSNVTRAARSSPTNFNSDTGGTSLDPITGGGRAPDDNLIDLVENVFGTGKTAAFTTFGNFSPNLQDNGGGPAGTTLDDSVGCFDALDGNSHSCSGVTIAGQPFGGFVQHVRPAFVPPFAPSFMDACAPKPLPPLSADQDLPNGNSGNPNNFKRSVGERAGPGYIGRGLMEAVPTNDILYFAANASDFDFGATAPPSPDPQRANGNPTSVTTLLGCPSTGCISGKANMIPRTFAVNTIASPPAPAGTTATGMVGGMGRFGLRANGVEIMQFAVGGLQGELSFTSLLNPAEINFPTLFPGGTATTPPTLEPERCMKARSETPGQPVDLSKLEVHLSELFSERNFIRNTSLPDFGDALRDVLEDALAQSLQKARRGDSKQGRDAAMVKRGAELFGIDLMEFAKRTISTIAIPATGGLEDNAIASDRKLNCVGCHIPIRRTGQSPAGLTASGVGDKNLSFRWAPIFSDQLLHRMPVIAGERETKNGLPRDVVTITRSPLPQFAQKQDGGGDDPGHGKSSKVIFDTFDVPRNLADDTFSNLKAIAEGSEFRTAPLMGIGRIGAPFLHDARVYLSKDTVDTTPAGTVTTNSRITNAPLVVRSLDDALLAAIELHDLPPPGGDASTPIGGGCPVPQTNNVTETADEVCPRYDTATSQTNRSDAREVIYRFRQLPPEDQQAVIEFLKQL